LIAPSRKQIIYQICDIEDNEISNIVSNSNKQKCDYHFGWLHSEEMKNIRNKLKEKAIQFLRGDKSELSTPTESATQSSKQNKQDMEQQNIAQENELEDEEDLEDYHFEEEIEDDQTKESDNEDEEDG
jgi:hypothetical protein